MGTRWDSFLGSMGLQRKQATSLGATSNNVMTLGDIVDRYDVVSVERGVNNMGGYDGAAYIVVSERPPAMPSFPGNGMIAGGSDGHIVPVSSGEPIKFADATFADLRELGSSAPSPFTSFMRQEYNTELLGQQGYEKYDRMRRSHGTVRGTLRAMKTPVLAARWFMEPASQKTVDKNAAEITWCALTEYMSISWTQFLTETLLMADFGYYMFEKVWDFQTIKGKRVLSWTKMAPRHPMDVKKWNYDSNGGPASVVMYAPSNDPAVRDITIPIDKLLVFTFDREAGNIEGISVLRSAYKHWYYATQLEKIDAIQKERHGIGIPVIKLPMNYSASDKTAADELGRNLRTNDRAHVVLPPNWELLFAKLEGHPVDAMASIQYHDQRIRENILATWLGDHTVGTNADALQGMFLKATRFIADIVCETINLYAIPQFIDYNFARAGYPKLRVRRIGETDDQRTLSFTVRNMVGAGVIIPDDALEAYIRNELDLPAMDPSTRRQLPDAQKQEAEQALEQGDVAINQAKATLEQSKKAAAAQPGMPNQTAPGQNQAPPQVPGGTKQAGPDKVGLPRQAAKPPVGPPAKQAGTDRSGKSSQK